VNAGWIGTGTVSQAGSLAARKDPAGKPQISRTLSLKNIIRAAKVTTGARGSEMVRPRKRNVLSCHHFEHAISEDQPLHRGKHALHGN